MRWYKHDSDASNDAKLKKLILRHGPIGYAVYFHCLELIAADISESNITFELEHDSEIIADNLKIKGTSDQSAIEVVEEVMRYAIQLRLFDENDGRIFCFKMLKRLDSSMTSSSKLRAMITAAKDSHDKVMTESCKTRLEETRLEQNRLEKNKKHCASKTDALHAFETFWDAFDYKKGKGGALQSWKKIKLTDSLLTEIVEGAEREARNRQALIAKGSTPKMAQGWLTERRWEDEHEESISQPPKTAGNIAAAKLFLAR